MNLYLISQDDQTGYGTYDCAIVAAESETDAQRVHPDPNWHCDENGVFYYLRSSDGNKFYDFSDCWAFTPATVCVEFLGVAKEGTKRGVILSSYNNG